MAYHIVTGGLLGGVHENLTTPFGGYLTDKTVDRDGVDGIGLALIRPSSGEIGRQQGHGGERAVTHLTHHPYWTRPWRSASQSRTQ